MDLDRFVAAHEASWRRLDELARRASRSGGRRLTAEELDELVALYRRTSTHLALARSRLRDPGLVARLSRSVAAASGALHAPRPRTLRQAARFFTDTFPAALWRCRPHLAAATALLFVPAILVVLHLGRDREALDAVASPASRAAYLEAGVDYYSAQPSAQFASQVFTNNVRVAILAFIVGVAACLLTALVLVANGLAVGEAVAVFVDAGRGWEFLGLLVPHGLIELSAVVVAAAGGLQLGWAVIDPGDRPRGRALAEEGRRAVALVLGAAAMLVVAGLIEGFVTGSALPTGVRVGLGVLVGVGFWAYAWAFGRRAGALAVPAYSAALPPR